MLDLETCKKYLKDKNMSDERIKVIRDFLYAISREIISNNIIKYEKTVKGNAKKVV